MPSLARVRDNWTVKLLLLPEIWLSVKAVSSSSASAASIAVTNAEVLTAVLDHVPLLAAVIVTTLTLEVATQSEWASIAVAIAVAIRLFEELVAISTEILAVPPDEVGTTILAGAGFSPVVNSVPVTVIVRRPIFSKVISLAASAVTAILANKVLADGTKLPEGVSVAKPTDGLLS